MSALDKFMDYFVVGKQNGVLTICRDFPTLEEAKAFAVTYIHEAKITIFKKEEELESILTLREYIKSEESGAYHNFIFDIGSIHIRTTGIDDFETYYNKDLLDRFYVIGDDRKDYGDNCENYECDHNLKLQMISVDKWKK